MASIEVKHSPTWDMPHFQFEMWMCCPSPGLGVLGLELGSSQSLGFSGSDQGAQRVPAAGGRYLQSPLICRLMGAVQRCLGVQ